MGIAGEKNGWPKTKIWLSVMNKLINIVTYSLAIQFLLIQLKVIVNSLCREQHYHLSDSHCKQYMLNKLYLLYYLYYLSGFRIATGSPYETVKMESMSMLCLCLYLLSELALLQWFQGHVSAPGYSPLCCWSESAPESSDLMIKTLYRKMRMFSRLESIKVLLLLLKYRPQPVENGGMVLSPPSLSLTLQQTCM